MTKKWLFIGSKTRDDDPDLILGEGIYRAHFDTANGNLTIIDVFREVENPTFLTMTRDGQYLYAVIETNDFIGKASGGVAAFKVDPKTASLTLLNCRATGGAHPCHISLDQTEKAVFVSNYTGGNLAVFPIAADGRLEEYCQLIPYEGTDTRPSHPHSAVSSKDGRYVFVSDLGLDQIYQYQFDVNALKLSEHFPPVRLKPGVGPRHFIFHPLLSIAYVLNELDSTVTVFDYHEAGYLTQKQTISSLPNLVSMENGWAAADIHLTRQGKFLYASNRGHNSLAIFRVDSQTGELTLMNHQPTLGDHPRNFMITTDDRWLLCANRNTDNVVSFSLNADTGALVYQDSFEVKKAICIYLSPLRVC